MSKKEKNRIGFIGVGKMGEALVRAILQARYTEPADIICSDVRQERRKLMAKKIKKYYWKL